MKIEKFLTTIDELNDRVGKVVSFLVVFMMVIILAEVVLRHVFNKPTLWGTELAGLVYGAYIVLGGGYVHRWGAHVGMDVLYRRFSLRGKAILDLVSFPLFITFCGLMLWAGGLMALKSLLILECTTSNWGPPWYPLKMTIPIAAFLILLQGLAKFIRDINIVISGREVA